MVGMLFSDRRSGTVHDVGTTAPPQQDMTQNLSGWGAAQSGARDDLAASMKPTDLNAPDPSVSRTDAWSAGPAATQNSSIVRQTLRPAQKRPMLGGVGWAAQPLALGASYAQKMTRRRTV